MRGVVVREFGPVEQHSIGEMPKPVPKDNEVLLEVKATAANYVDLLVIGGKYQFLPERPFIPGKGPAGIVAEIGKSVTAFKPGDRILAMAEQGGYGEFVAVNESQCYLLPEGMSFVNAAATALIYDTSWFALRERARFSAGETVLVLGASGAVGLASVQLAKAIGAKVLAGIANPDKAQMVKDAGADHIIDLSADNLRDSLREQVYEVTDGKGADIILDMLGGDIFDAALRALAWSGRLVVIGFASGRIPTIKANYLLLKNIEVSGLQVSDYRKRRPQQVADCFAEVFSLIESGKLKSLPTTIYPISEFAKGLGEIESRKARGRVILTQH